MKNTAVIYASRNGSTEKYAQWIAKECDADLFEAKKAVIDEIMMYPIVIFGGCVYGGMIDDISLIKNNLNLLEKSKVIVFTVGLTQPGDDAAFKQVLSRNFTPDECDKIEFYHFPGAINYKKLKLAQRIMMRVLKKSIETKEKANRTQVEQCILDTYGGAVDFTNSRYIQALVENVLQEKASHA